MSTALVEAPKFTTIRDWGAGLIGVIAEAAVMSLANYPMTLAFDARKERSFLLYWMATTSVAGDRLDFEIYTLDGDAGAPQDWILVDYVHALPRHEIRELQAARSSVLLVKLTGAAVHGASAGLKARAALL